MSHKMSHFRAVVCHLAETGTNVQKRFRAVRAVSARWFCTQRTTPGKNRQIRVRTVAVRWFCTELVSRAVGGCPPIGATPHRATRFLLAFKET